MQITFGGVRGSAACAEADKTAFGGHTTCLLVAGDGGELLLLDVGSGVRTVTDQILAAGEQTDPPVLHILLTHLHLDHLLGLPMLPLLHDKRWRVEIMAATPLRAALDQLMAPPLWPFRLADCAAEVVVREVGLELTLGGLTVRGAPVAHPNGCTAWRVDETASEAALVMATDTEWAAAGQSRREQLLELCRLPRPADLLVMDGHFSPGEIADKAGWGHSSTGECVEVARAGGVDRLLITHHAPGNDDDRLAAMAAEARNLWPHADLARQGLTVSLGRTVRKEPRT